MKAKAISILGLILLASFAFGSPELKVGDPAPPLEIGTWLKGQPFEGFQRGKAYVIEFWATWCGSCHAAMPHISELVKQMQGKPVEFVSIADEEPGLVEALMKTRVFETSVALDAKGKTFGAYGVRVLPHTIVINTQGRIAAITRPEAVTADSLNDVLASKPINLPIKSNKAANLDWDAELGVKLDSSEAVYQSVLQLSDAVSGSIRSNLKTGRITADGVGLRALIVAAYQSEFTNTECSIPNPDRGPYRVSIKAPDGSDETARSMLQDLLHRSFDFKAEWREVERPMEVIKYDPSKASATLKKSTALKSDGFAKQGQIQMIRVTPATIVKLVAAFGVGKAAIDETGLTGWYDIDLRWTPGDLTSFSKALSNAGLSLVEQSRKTKVLFVEPKS